MAGFPPGKHGLHLGKHSRAELKLEPQVGSGLLGLPLFMAIPFLSVGYFLSKQLQL